MDIVEYFKTHHLFRKPCCRILVRASIQIHLAFPVFHPLDTRAKPSSLLALKSEAVDARTVVHCKDVTLGHCQPAKVNPTFHGIATLVEELPRLGSQSKHNCRACPRAPFLGGQKV